MKSRRKFIKTLGAGALLAPSVIPDLKANLGIRTSKPIRIGIIGAENSHTAAFGKLFNIDKKFPGVEVTMLWGETDEYAQKSMKAGNIPVQVKDPAEMMGKIDALIVDHRHAKYHLEPAGPFVEAGIPSFIDKPFCYRASEGLAFLQMARKKGTAVTSYSSIAHSNTTLDLRAQVKAMPDISQVIITGPVDPDSPYGGIFFYGVHMVEPLMAVFGEDIQAVKVSRGGKAGNALLKFTSGLMATFIFKNKAYGWETYVETNKAMVELKPKVKENDPPRADVDMVEMFATGKEPRSHQSILNGVSVLEALEKSVQSEKWTDVEYLNIGG